MKHIYIKKQMCLCTSQAKILKIKLKIATEWENKQMCLCTSQAKILKIKLKIATEWENDHAEYHEKLLRSYDFPSGVLLPQGSEIKDCAIVFGEHFKEAAYQAVITDLYKNY